jgi:hypothetical protein
MRFSEFFGFSSGKSKKKKEPKAAKTTSASEKHKKKMAALAKYDAKKDGKKNGTKPAASNKPAASDKPASSKKATPNKKYDLSPAGRKAATKAREDSYSKTKPKAKARPKPKAKAETKAKPKRAKVTGKGSKLTADGKANVTAEQLKKSGLSLRGYMNQWNKSGKRPAASAKTASPAKSRQGKTRAPRWS